MTTPREHLVNPIETPAIRTCALLYTNIILKFVYFLGFNRYNAILKVSLATVDGDSAPCRITAGGEKQTAAAAKGYAMWKHHAGRMDFHEPLFQLLERGWRFQEFGPTAGAREGGCWAVTGFHRWARVRVDRLERRDAWAAAVRLALKAAIKRRPFLTAPTTGTRRSSPDDPTVFDEEQMRLRAMGWSFSEHQTAQESGRVGWVVSGTRRGRRIRALDDDRSDAWGTALILAGVTST